MQFESELHSSQLAIVQGLHLLSEVSSHVPFFFFFFFKF